MRARVLDGREIAAGVMATVAERTARLLAVGITPQLSFVTIGMSAPAQLYVHRLERLAGKVGIIVRRDELPVTVGLAELDRHVAGLNEDPSVDGVIVQMPLPLHLTSADISLIIEPRKDVDGITVANAGRLYLGMPGPTPSTAQAMMHILTQVIPDPAGYHAVVIGRSQVVGHPISELLLECDATVTVTHRRTRDLAGMTRQADILMVGAGAPHLVRADMIRPGVVIVDAGINATTEGVIGDVDFEGCVPIAAAITPVPGGVGPVTNAVLLRNVVDSAEQRNA